MAWGQELCQAQAKLLSVYTALASRDTIRSKSYRMVCSNAQPEESGNQDYDDHDADDVKNVHCTLRARHARLQVKARCSHTKHFVTILSSGVRETIKSVRLDHRELVPSACHRQQGTSRSKGTAPGGPTSVGSFPLPEPSDPLAGKPQPRFLVERVDSALGTLATFVR
jgi:hypothetical protein